MWHPRASAARCGAVAPRLADDVAPVSANPGVLAMNAARDAAASVASSGLITHDAPSRSTTAAAPESGPGSDAIPSGARIRRHLSAYAGAMSDHAATASAAGASSPPAAKRVALASDWLRLVGAVYLMRCMTVTLTSLPGPAPHCQPGAVSRGEYAPPANWHEIATTTLSSIGGRTCGDLLFSGHAAVATVTTLLLVRTQRPDAARVAASTYRRAWCYARCESGRGLL